MQSWTDVVRFDLSCCTNVAVAHVSEQTRAGEGGGDIRGDKVISDDWSRGMWNGPSFWTNVVG